MKKNYHSTIELPSTIQQMATDGDVENEVRSETKRLTEIVTTTKVKFILIFLTNFILL